MNHSTVSASTASAQTFSIKKTALAGIAGCLNCRFIRLFHSDRCIQSVFRSSTLSTSSPAFFLGPVYGVSMAFCVSLIRNILGTGSLLAFPGSMVGAFLGAYLFQKTGRFLLAYLGEVVGTGIIGGTLCYPVAVLLMGKDVALFFYVLPFLMSTACGTAIAFLLIEFMRRIGLFSYLKRLLDAQ